MPENLYEVQRKTPDGKGEYVYGRRFTDRDRNAHGWVRESVLRRRGVPLRKAQQGLIPGIRMLDVKVATRDEKAAPPPKSDAPEAAKAPNKRRKRGRKNG